ncbi:unnamed protein product [Prorocentrum cordatum]|uniref:Uncharacterized protein n=1 Tax=Prorocentrum cordatum TaxID=2364126 RepID=A0ABN9UIX6_9DINO|nr:unnamed protein product [Polarella glacialis]
MIQERSPDEIGDADDRCTRYLDHCYAIVSRTSPEDWITRTRGSVPQVVEDARERCDAPQDVEYGEERCDEDVCYDVPRDMPQDEEDRQQDAEGAQYDVEHAEDAQVVDEEDCYDAPQDQVAKCRVLMASTRWRWQREHQPRINVIGADYHSGHHPRRAQVPRRRCDRKDPRQGAGAQRLLQREPGTPPPAPPSEHSSAGHRSRSGTAARALPHYSSPRPLFYPYSAWFFRFSVFPRETHSRRRPKAPLPWLAWWPRGALA